MKRVIIAACAAVLAMAFAGCNTSSKEMNFGQMPPELKDCKIFNMKSDTGASIIMAKCPNSDTSVQQDKMTAIVLEVKKADERKIRADDALAKEMAK
jgi:hypothetical protein